MQKWLCLVLLFFCLLFWPKKKKESDFSVKEPPSFVVNKRERVFSFIDAEEPWNEKNEVDAHALKMAVDSLKQKSYLQALEWLNHPSLCETPLARTFIGKLYEKGLGVECSYEKALACYNESVKQQEPHAQFYLAQFYERGLVVERSYIKAYIYYEKAALKGYAPAQFCLGLLYESGLGVARSQKRAVGYYRQAAEQGYLPALVAVGGCYEMGKEVNQSYARALEYYQQAAEQESAEAMYRLACFYKEGLGVEQSASQSISYFQSAASLGHLDSLFYLGCFYEEGWQVPQSPQQAAHYYTLAANQGHALAQCYLGNCYEMERGVEYSAEKARYYYALAAEQKNVHGLYVLGNYFEEGLGGEQSYEQAAHCYKKAIKQQYGPAFFSLGLLYHKGLGVCQSYEKAFDCYKRGAHLGNVNCLHHLAYFYEKGLGTGKDLVLAVEYYKQAEQQGCSLSYHKDLNALYGISDALNPSKGLSHVGFSQRAKKIIQEKQKEAQLRSDAQEVMRAKKWLDILSTIPFGRYVQPSFSSEKDSSKVVSCLQQTSSTLNQAVHGHTEAKEMLLEMVGQWVRKGRIEGGVIGIQGYCGTGKTALITKGLSKALHRPFSFISLGGKHDAVFLTGSEDVYVGAHHGRIVEALIESGCMNPIIYFDELDKACSRWKGDEIMNTLVHLTDPVQNQHFQDLYFRDIDIDLSKVLFVFSYNDERAIPTALRDRMTIIHTEPPSLEDKLVIAKQHLIPEVWKEVGLSAKELDLKDEALEWMIEEYTHEVGVRYLKQLLFSIARRINVMQLLDPVLKEKQIVLDKQQLHEVLGEPRQPFKEGDKEEYYAYCLQKTAVDEKVKNGIRSKISSSVLPNSVGDHASKWLDHFFRIPFGNYSGNGLPKTFEETRGYLQDAKQALQQAVFGHDKTKQALLEVIGEWVSSHCHKGLILGLQGPPGNGKTSLVLKGLQKALQRPVHFIPLGGVTHGAALAGHDETYVGSHPGQIIEALILTGCMNPIIYFDELDKVSKTARGEEIIGVLTHLTDTTQNNKFRDRYFSGIDFDLSQAVFIFSYNDPYSIDPILRDRMSIIQTEELSEREKCIIAQEYLLPEIMQELSLDPESIVFPESELVFLIQHYTYEAGVRDLKRHLTTLLRKINLERLQEPNASTSPVTIDRNMIESSLDVVIFPSLENDNEKALVGVVNALSASFIGPGGVGTLQVTKSHSTVPLAIHVTGNVKKVGKESVEVAKTVAWNALSAQERQRILRNDSFGFHVHFSRAAIPKDGPSGGAALTVAITSLLREHPVGQDLAITGEIDIQGKITAIGGLRSKLLGAKRANIRKVYIPKQNEKEWVSLFKSEPMLQDSQFEVIAVEHIDELLSSIFAS